MPMQDAAAAEVAARDYAALEARACREFVRRLSINLSELTFASLTGDHPSFPLRLEVRREKIYWARFCKAPFKQPAWHEYARLLEEYSSGCVGTVMRSGDVQGRLMILHNYWRGEPKGGRVRVCIAAGRAGEGSILEEYQDFLEAMQLSWCP